MEENNERESLTKIHIKDMLSSKDLSCATHLTLIGVPNETPPKTNTQGASKGLKPTSILFPHTHIIPQTIFAKLCHSQDP
jgi:hypothetical protein